MSRGGAAAARLAWRIAAWLALATGAAGCTEGSSSSADAVSVSDAASPPATIRIAAAPLAGSAPLTVRFAAVVEGLAPAERTLRWDFGDGAATSGDVAPVYTYRTAGLHRARVELAARGAAGVLASAEVAVDVVAPPDLRVAEFALLPSTELAPGAHLRFTDRVANDGGAVLEPISRSLRFVGLSGDDLARPWYVPLPALAPLGAGAVTDGSSSHVQLPEDAPTGRWVVTLVVDPDDDLVEADERNNDAASADLLHIDPAFARRPDLEPQPPVWSQASASPGDSILVTVPIHNAGDGEAAGYAVTASLEPTSGEAPLPWFEERVLRHGPGETIRFVRGLPLPDGVSDGAWHVRVSADPTDLVVEADEENNAARSAVPLLVTTASPDAADLTVAALVVPTRESYRGGSARVQARVKNLGTNDAPASDVVVLLSADGSLSRRSDPVLGGWPTPPLEAGAEVALDGRFEVPVGALVGPLVVGAWVDPDRRVAELDEGNNVRLAATHLTVATSPRFDLAVSDVTFEPVEITAGTSFDVRARVVNAGSLSAGAFEVRAVLSADSAVDAKSVERGEDVAVATLAIDDLTGGEAVDAVMTATAPLALQHDVVRWRVAVLAGDEAMARDDVTPEDNVAFAAASIRIDGAAGGCIEDDREPDDTAAQASLSLGDGAVMQGAACDAHDWYRVPLEAGDGLTATLHVEPLLSLEPTAPALDLEILDPSGRVVARGTAAGPVEHLDIPFAGVAGDWLVRVLVAAPAGEARYELMLRRRPPDDGPALSVTSHLVAPRSTWPGGLLGAEVVVANRGDRAAGPFTVAWSAVTDRGDAVPLADARVSELFAGRTLTLTRELRLPADLAGGTWQIRVVADSDGEVAERDEADNEALSDILDVDASRACLEDAHEPDGATAIAPVRPLVDGAIEHRTTLCPGDEDWLGVEVAVGEALSATLTYDHDPAAGALALDLLAPDGQTVLVRSERASGPQVHLPAAFLPGPWWLRIHHLGAPDGTQGAPYSTHLRAQAELAERPCVADRFEPDWQRARPAPLGCGTHELTACPLDVDALAVDLDDGAPLDLTLRAPPGTIFLTAHGVDAAPPLATLDGPGTLRLEGGAARRVVLVARRRPDAGAATPFAYQLDVAGPAGHELRVGALEVEPAQAAPGAAIRLTAALANTCGEATPSFDLTVGLAGAEARPVEVHRERVEGLAAAETRSWRRKIVLPPDLEVGDYAVHLELDPDGETGDAHRGDNQASAPLAVVASCPVDPTEPDDSPALAAPLVSDAVVAANLCPGDEDWYAVAVEAGRTIEATLEFTHLDGDLDLDLGPATEPFTPAVSSSGEGDVEVVRHLVRRGGRWLIRVRGFDGGAGPYRLRAAW